jgi:septum formation protein
MTSPRVASRSDLSNRRPPIHIGTANNSDLLQDPQPESASNLSLNSPLGPTLVLASSSPRRLALLAQIGIAPSAIIAPDIDETPARAELPRLYAQRMARAKSSAVAVPGQFVLAADTVVAVGRRILPKAATEQEARACIDLLSGRRHRVLTAVVLTAPDGRRAERLSESVVGFSRLTGAQKTAWLALGEWEGKAGGYAINGAAESFVRFLSGSFSGVVGLPLFETAQMLRGFGWPIP